MLPLRRRSRKQAREVPDEPRRGYF